MRVREDTIRRRDGSTGIYGVVAKPDFVVIVPVEDDGRVHLVEQYRYPVKGRYWELKAPGNRHREPSRWKWRGANYERRRVSKPRGCFMPGTSSKPAATRIIRMRPRRERGHRATGIAGLMTTSGWVMK